MDRLGDALGNLIDEVATSKQDFLVKAAESDGFFFADGSFKPAQVAQSSFAVTRVEDLASIDDRGRRLHLLANDSPKGAVEGARELADSVCRTILRLTGEPAPGKTASLADVVKSTLKALKLIPAGGNPNKGESLVARSLQELSATIAGLDVLRSALLPRHARLAASAAVAFAGFVAETYAELTGTPTK